MLCRGQGGLLLSLPVKLRDELNMPTIKLVTGFGLFCQYPSR